MNNELLNFSFFGFNVLITPWKLIGFLGVFTFSARWFVQMWASKAKGQPVVPTLFWYMSIVGSLLCLAYFVWGKNDSVGILAYLFPTGVSFYNLYLHRRNKRQVRNDV